MTIRKVLTYGIGTILITAVLVTLIVLINTELARAPIGQSSTKSSRTAISDQSLSDSLACNRMTDDVRETDPLCNDFDYARELFARGITFDSDFPNTDGDTYFVILLNNDTAQPVKNTDVTVRQTEDFVCIQPPCQQDSRVLFEGTTDDLGVLAVPDSVVLPEDPIQQVTVTVNGYEPIVITNLVRTPPHFIVALR